MDFGGDGSSDTTTVNTVGRIPKAAANGTVIFLFVLALLSVAARTFIRVQHRTLNWLDDGFLFAAVVFMTVAFGLYFSFIDDVYITELLIYDTGAALDYLEDATTIGIHVQTVTIPYIILSLSGIFSVKFSFLFFFYNIFNQIRSLLLFWRGVITYTAIVWAFSVGFSVYGCPYVDERALNCAQGDQLWKAVDASVGLIVCDITSDILIVTIAVLLIKQIHLPWKKKLYLAGSLCVSLVMVAVAILQVATLTYGGVAAIDVVWQIYFQFVELTLAIIVVCSMAFRAFFVQRGSRGSSGSDPSGGKSPNWSGYKTYKKMWHKLWSSSSEESDAPRIEQDIPRPTLTGVQTYVDRAAGSPWPDANRDGGMELRETQLGETHLQERSESSSSMSQDEYHRFQRNVKANPRDLEKGPPTESDYAKALQATSTSESEPSTEKSERRSSFLKDASRNRRSRIGISRHDGAKLAGSGTIPTSGRVSPMEDPDSFTGSSRPSWEPSSAEPSPEASRKPSDPEAGQVERPLPPSPPLESEARQGVSSDGPARVSQSAVPPREPVPRRLVRPRVEEEPMRESGLKRAIESSFQMASDIQPHSSGGFHSK